MQKTGIDKLSNKTDVSQLLPVLNALHPISASITDFISSRCIAKKVGKKKLLVRTGEVCNYIYFIRKGLIRGFIKEGNREITTWMTAENEFVTSISGLIKNDPSIENIQTIEDCQLLALSFDDLEILYEHFPEFNIVIRKLLQYYYLDAENRAVIARIHNAEKRYQYFLQQHGHLANRVPLKYIASFLGLTIETISRVRKKLSCTTA